MLTKTRDLPSSPGLLPTRRPCISLFHSFHAYILPNPIHLLLLTILFIYTKHTPASFVTLLSILPYRRYGPPPQRKQHGCGCTLRHSGWLARRLPHSSRCPV